MDGTKNNGFKIYGDIAGVIWRNIRGYGILASFYYFVEAIFPAVLVKLNAGLFEAALNLINGESKEIVTIYQLIFMFAVVYVIRLIIDAVGSVAINIGVYEKVTLSLKQNLIQKSSKLSLLDLENPDIHKLYVKARDCVEKEQISAAYMTMIVIVSCIVSFIVSVAVMMTYSKIVIFTILLSLLPQIFESQIMGRKIYSLYSKNIKGKVRAEYFWGLLMRPESVRELRLNDSFMQIKNNWYAANEQIQKELYQCRLQEAIWGLGCLIVRCIGFGGSIAIIMYLTMQKEISIGAFGAALIACGQLQEKARVFFSELGKLHEKLLFSNDYFGFIALKEEKQMENKEDAQVLEKIQVKNVCFRYPGTSQYALKDISFEITKGESIAIVGENGSGKTTLSKLLIGIYEQESGKIFYDGQELSNVNKSLIWKNISIMNQNFVRYQLTLRENVAISNIDDLDNAKKIHDCLNRIGVNYKNIDMQLGKQFGGVEYSGGQWQRIAVARALFKEAEIYILDEPTSALDPIVESEILAGFLRILKNKTCLIVSHRIGLCKHVNKIIVMKNGEIAGIGNHEALLKNCLEYQKLYISQSKWYENAEGQTPGEEFPYIN